MPRLTPSAPKVRLNQYSTLFDNQRCWATRDEARRDLFAYIEGDYSRQRIHSALGYITLEQAERNAR